MPFLISQNEDLSIYSHRSTAAKSARSIGRENIQAGPFKRIILIKNNKNLIEHDAIKDIKKHPEPQNRRRRGILCKKNKEITKIGTRKT